jgi:S1-C subfamily serine protease
MGSTPLHLDLAALNRSLVKLRAVVPEDAFTAGILGSERTGSGVVINADGLVLTIGYLITEASDVWLSVQRGTEIAAHALAYDQVTGFGLVLPLQRLQLPPLEIGSSADLPVGASAHVLSYREFAEPFATTVSARREFAGAWEYLLEDAIFTVPAHSRWSGAALIDGNGTLVGLGSLLVRETIGAEEINANMFVPVDLLKPILADMIERGRAARQARPWLGIYAAEARGQVYVTGVVNGGPAHRADIREGDRIDRVAEQQVSTLPEFYRRIWAMGPAGTGIPLTRFRDGARADVNVRSVDRSILLKRPPAH